MQGSVIVDSKTKKKNVRAEIEYHIVRSGYVNCISAYCEGPYIGYMLRNYVTDTSLAERFLRTLYFLR